MGVNIIRLVYFLFQFIYPIIVAIVHKGPVAFNVVCTVFAFVGLVYDTIQIVIEFKEMRKERKRKLYEVEAIKKEPVENDEVQSEALSQKLPGNINGLAEPTDQLIKDNSDPASAVDAVHDITVDQDSAEKETTTPRKF